MFASNIERNKIVWDLWEEGLTVDQISFRTGIPRSTVGYYVRKFNRSAMKGKPIAIPKKRGVEGTRGTSPFHNYLQIIKEMGSKKVRKNILLMLNNGRYEELYYLLMDLKLIRQLHLIVTPEMFDEVFE